jgi:hypothetical protein
MIVAMTVMGMVEMVIYQIIDMIGMRHRRVSTRRAMLVISLMTVTVVLWRAGSRVVTAGFDLMFNHAFGGHMMQVTIVKVIAVAIVFDRHVAAAGTMLMLVIAVY